VTKVDEALRGIEAAFADTPRPPDPELAYSPGHDHDFELLYRYAHWREVPDTVIERQDAALAFLGAAGFRQFLPAYMSYALRNARSEWSAVESAVNALAPGSGDLRDFSISKYKDRSAAERQAVLVFLEAVQARDDFGDPVLADALAYWRALT